MRSRTFVAVVAIAVASILASQVGDAWARARGGGSRGSRSYSAPVRPSPVTPGQPASPSRTFNQPNPAQSPMSQRPGLFSGLMGGIAGFALGGLLGSMLFGGLGGLGRGFGGFGLMELLLIAGALYLLWRFFIRRRDAAEPAYAMAGAPSRTQGASAYGVADRVGGDVAASSAGGGTATAEVVNLDLERGLGHIRQMDAGFDPVRFADWARQQFAVVQNAVTTRDIAGIRDRLAPEMYGVLLTQCDELRAAGRTSRVERTDIARAEVTEAWQENGRDFVTVYLTGSLVDYTVDDRTGEVVEGSRTQPQTVQEFWTFTRPVGPGAWKLSAIQTA
jgi:predicted lipid-binding transport protein (Tim44 family)